MGQTGPIVPVLDFSARQPAMLSRTAGFGQKRSVEVLMFKLDYGNQSFLDAYMAVVWRWHS